MKKMMAAATLLSVISMNSFALANPNSGKLLVGKVDSGKALITISGAPAKKIFGLLAVKSSSVRLNSSMTAELKSATDISCLNVESVNAFECKILVNAKGDAEKLSSYKVVAKTNKEGFATGGGFGDYSNVTLNGEAATELSKSLTEAKKSSKRMGSLLTTYISGLSVSCETSAEVAVSTTCKLSVDGNGNVNGNFAR